MKKKARFIVNPISGVGGQKLTVELIYKHADRDMLNYEVVHTQYAGHATELAKDAVDKGFDIAVAVGGDGTMNEVAQALIGTNTALGIIPRGSGNGLARHLKIPTAVIPAISVINAGRAFTIDTMKVNDRSCIGMAGIGFDAYVAHLFASYGKRGLASYAQIVLKEFKKYRPQKFTIEINGEVFEKELFLMSFANSAQFGNNVKIAPGADISDGMMELCMLRKIPTLLIPHFAYRLFNEKAKASKYLETISTKEVKITSSFHQLHIDGEPYTSENDTFIVKIIPHSLKVWIPSL